MPGTLSQSIGRIDQMIRDPGHLDHEPAPFFAGKVHYFKKCRAALRAEAAISTHGLLHFDTVANEIGIVHTRASQLPTDPAPLIQRRGGEGCVFAVAPRLSLCSFRFTG
jgi:hypothetical protein